MKDLNELITEAAEVADERTKVFNELTTSIKETLIPTIVALMKGYGLNRVYICTKAKPIKGFNGYPDPQTESWEYGICIMGDGTICEVEYDYMKDGWGHACDKLEDGTICEVEYDYMKDGWGHACDKLEDYQLLKSGAINFACELIKKIEILNNKYSKLNNDAQSLKNLITNL